MNPHDNFDENDDKTFLERHKIVLSVVAVTVIALGVFTLQGKFSKPGSSQSKGPAMVSIHLPPPPSTPPPPVPTPPPQEIKQDQKMIEQAPVDDKEDKPDDKPPDAAPVTTSIVGNGPDPFGLKSGNGGGSGIGAESRQRSKFGWYAAQVQTAIGDVLRKDPRTRSGNFGTKVRVWSDITGRITRAKVSPSTGDPAIDEAINQSLTGIQLKEAPPSDMPMPIVMRVSAQRQQ